MKVYKLEVMIIDHDEIGEQEIVYTVEDTKYPNRCIMPKVIEIDERDIGEWSDDNPLNNSKTTYQTFKELFDKK